jgi:hypothetical protein
MSTADVGMVQLIIRVPLEVRVWLAEESKRSGAPQAEIARRALGAAMGRSVHPSGLPPIEQIVVPVAPVSLSSDTRTSTSSDSGPQSGPRLHRVPDVSSSSEVSDGSAPPCVHADSKPSVGSLRRCQDCGATRGLDGVWR